MPLQFTITNAGRAAIAQVGGAIGPVTLTKIAIGSGGYTPTATQTALQTEIKRLDPSGSSVPVPGTISITAQDNSADSYSVKEIGLYTNNNVLFAICAQSAVIMTKASGSVALFAMDFVMTNVPAGTVTVGNVGFTYSQATETAMGVLGIATTAEAQAGTIDTKIITPLKLAQVTATESRRGVIALASSTEAQALVPDATKALTVARLLDRTATTGRAGVVVLASSTDTQNGTDSAKAVTPAGLASRTASETRSGIVQLASATEAQTGTDTGKAVTPAGLKSSLAGYATTTHTHAASAIVSGTIDNARLTQATSSAAGIVELADNTETQAGTATTLAVTPAGLASRTATESRAGVIQLASTSEIQAGTNRTKAVTPELLTWLTANTTRAGIVELADNTETQAGTDAARAVTPASLASAAALFVPPGAVLPFAMNVVPSGWLAANGAAVSRTLYPALFASIGTLYGVGDGSTTFALPDLRGYFVRGSGTNADGTAAGTFGTKQADAFKSHSHPYTDKWANFGAKTTVGGANETGWKYTDGYTTGNLTTTATGDLTETRPKNIALLYCIKF